MSFQFTCHLYLYCSDFNLLSLTFNEFKLEEKILQGLKSMGFEKATPIQEEVIPLVLQNEDVIACAQTGTGKTAAYLLPILDSIVRLHDAEDNNKESHVHTIVIVPTRELAVQIDQQVDGFAYFLPVNSASIYGGVDGMSWEMQKSSLSKGSDIIVATPGKLLAHLSFEYANLNNLKCLILDEADRMLDMGFFDDIMRIIDHLPAKRQTLLFSATMPPKIRELSKKILKNPKEISLALSTPAEGIIQGAYLVHDRDKINLINLLIKEKNLPSILVFAATKSDVKKIEVDLRKNKFDAKGIHSDLDQDQREEVLRAFKNKKIQILVATNIVSRGIDIENVSLVINYNVPQDAEDYVHRVGRTARAESTGVALTFINNKDQADFKNIETLIGTTVRKLALPTEIPKGPDYDPGRKPRYGGRNTNRKRNPNKRFSGKSKRPFKGKGSRK
ncbi:MAG: DEAD/DEAH box helicase [Bacteroidetes bacterium]|nr:DEAD/DEAH box helicase [Bacteroidota bacterium]